MNVHENDARASSWAFFFFIPGPWTADVFSRALFSIIYDHLHSAANMM